MKLIIASNNAHKVREIKEILHGYFSDIVTLKEAGLSIEVEEDGTTFEENAAKKARETLRLAQGFDAALADDSGLAVDALGGAPGVYSARYAGDCHDDELNNKKLMADMKDVPDGQRSCRFVSVIALARRDGTLLETRGEVEGTLLYGPQGENGFGYDPYFYYEPAGCSFAELSPEQKNAVSHRKRALEAMKAALEQGK